MITALDVTSSIVTATLLATFLTIFYFTYVHNVEKSIVENQIKYITDELADDLQVLPLTTRTIIKRNLQRKSKNNSNNNENADDISVEENNKKVIRNAFIAIAIINVVGFGIVYYFSKRYNLDLWQIYKENLIILAFIALTEFVFLNAFVRNYISVDSNSLKLFTLNKLLQIKSVKSE
jgi:hypothetical protein